MRTIYYFAKVYAFRITLLILMFSNKLIIKLLSFKSILLLFTNKKTPTENYNFTTKEISRTILIFSEIALLESRLPVKFLCFEKALTVLVLARVFHLPATVNFGITKNDLNEIKAHAWSQIANYDITGYESKDDFSIVYKMHYTP